jgi:hypothetical protein
MPFGKSTAKVLWQADVTDIDIAWAGRPMVSGLLRAALTVTRVILSQSDCTELSNLVRPRSRIGGIDRGNRHYDQRCSWIREFDVDFASQYLELPLWIGAWPTTWSGYNPHYSIEGHWMMLVPDETRGQPNEYRRLGIVEYSWFCAQDDLEMVKTFILDHLRISGSVTIV